MQQSEKQRSRVIFVGNLPFEYTEEQLTEVFNSVGPVVSFRLVFDHSTNKPKGFGFCEYRDPETAASALRNLQAVEVGGRALRLDFADADEPPKRGSRPSGGNDRRDQSQETRPLPTGVPLPPGVSATDSISQTLATMPPGQLLDIMSQMKALVTTSPNDARALLTSNPQLAYALFQAMLMMNIVDPSVLQKMVPAAAAAPAAYSAPPPSSYNARPPPMSYNGPPAPPAAQPQPQGYGNYQGKPPIDPRVAAAQAPYAGGVGTPPPAASTPVPQDTSALIQQVLSMTQAQIDSLPEESRNTIMQIRAQAAAGGRR